uniref:Uncharacterized protein n=1 Tax=Arundo donax TaxID=35708 RepID=A0A0A9H5H2_ARUDO
MDKMSFFGFARRSTIIQPHVYSSRNTTATVLKECKNLHLSFIDNKSKT